MEDFVVVSKAKYVAGYVLAITFGDWVTAEIDFSPWIIEKYAFFAPLKDKDYFRQFSLDGWTVIWPNGADIAPETLHSIAVGASRPQSA